LFLEYHFRRWKDPQHRPLHQYCWRLLCKQKMEKVDCRLTHPLKKWGKNNLAFAPALALALPFPLLLAFRGKREGQRKGQRKRKVHFSSLRC
jgi:hypothetical protein